MIQKESMWVDATGAPLQLGDWVVYLIPSMRRLTMGPIMKGTNKSVSVLEIRYVKYTPNTDVWGNETTVARPFDIVVKIDTPWKFIKEQTDKNSGFCAGVTLGIQELHKVIAPGNSINTDDLITRLVDQQFTFAEFSGSTWNPTSFDTARENRLIWFVQGLTGT